MKPCALFCTFLVSIFIAIGWGGKRLHTIQMEDSRTLTVVNQLAAETRDGILRSGIEDAWGTVIRTRKGFAQSAGRDRTFDTNDDVVSIR